MKALTKAIVLSTSLLSGCVTMPQNGCHVSLESGTLNCYESNKLVGQRYLTTEEYQRAYNAEQMRLQSQQIMMQGFAAGFLAPPEVRQYSHTGTFTVFE